MLVVVRIGCNLPRGWRSSWAVFAPELWAGHLYPTPVSLPVAHSLTSRPMAAHSRIWLVLTCSFTPQRLLSCLVFRHCSRRTEVSCRSWILPHHSELCVLEHLKYRFVLLIVVHDVHKGMRIRVTVCPMLQRSLLLPGFPHGAPECSVLMSQDAESFGSGTTWQRECLESISIGHRYKV